MNETATVERPAATPETDAWEWAIVEIFGHRRHVGKSREEERFGAKMIRIDVPKLGPGPDEITWSSHYYGGASLFSYTPTDERTVMNYAERSYTPAIPYRDHGQSMDEAAADNFGLTAGDLDEDEDEQLTAGQLPEGGAVNQCPSCKRMFRDGETCPRGGCPMGGDV